MENTINIKLIEQYLQNNNISKKKFCKLCNISYYTLRQVLTGKVASLNTLCKIAWQMVKQVWEILK